MKILNTLFLLLLSASFLFAQTPNYSRAKIFLEGQSIDELASLGLEIEHSHSSEEGSLTLELSEPELREIAAAGFRYEILIKDLARYTVEQNTASPSSAHSRSGHCGERNYKVPENFKLGSMGGFFTYEEMLSNLDSMAQKYPSIITARVPADPSIKTHEGRDLFWLRISDNAAVDEEEPEMLYNSLIHAREPASLAQLIYYMWYLLENYGTDPEVTYLVDNTEMYFMPCINPDGYIHNQTTNPNGGGFWRKNKRDNNGNGIFDNPGDGVDLNRNFDYNWGLNDSGSSPNPSAGTYRGPSAFSEPETQILRNFCQAHDFKIVLNYHSFSNVMLYPYSHNDQLADPRFYAMGDVITRHNHYYLGTAFEAINYRTNGDAVDWMYGDSITKPKIFGYIPEVGSRFQGFWPRSDEIIPLAQLNLYQNLHSAHLLLQYAELIAETPSVVNQEEGYLPYRLTRYGLQDGSFNVSIEGLTDNVLTIGMTNTHDLPELATLTDSIYYQLDPAIEENARIQMRIAWSNGRFTWSDTLSFCYAQAPVPFSDAANNFSQWTDNGMPSDWGLSFQEYHSAPSSITNPVGSIGSPLTTSLQTRDPISLEGAEAARLCFWGKWDIRDALSYGMLSVSTDFGASFTPVCGKYTIVEESGSIVTDLPIYEGLQSQWVKEEIDLSDFLGQEVLFRFEFARNDGFRDAIYLDDFELVVKRDGPVSVQPLAMQAGSPLHFQPNPASASTTLVFDTPLKAPALLRMSDLSGRLYTEQRLSSGQTIQELNTADWPSGLYHFQLRSSSGQLLYAGKLAVTH